jgi:2-iminobutanoate/2-iminopropanoate deaminase
MKMLWCTLVVVLMVFSGCRPGEEDLRRIVREEMSRGAEKKIIKPVNVIGPYSPAVKVGNFLFVSGQIALDPQSGALKTDNIEAETQQVLSNLRRVLAAAGYDSTHVVSATVFLKNMSDYQKMNAIYGGYFQEGNYPARVAVQIGDLPKQANVEISAIAWKP